LKSFFFNAAQKPTKPWLLLMPMTEEGKILKSVSACRLMRSIDTVVRTLQMVTLQRNGSILLEERTDQQIEQLLYLTTTEGLLSSCRNPQTLNLCKGVGKHDDYFS
jgi:hypothetical protein